MVKTFRTTYDFLPGFKDAQLAESDVEGGGEVGAVWLLDHDDIDGSRKSRPVDLVVPVPDRAGNVGTPVRHTHFVFSEVADPSSNTHHYFCT